MEARVIPGPVPSALDAACHAVTCGYGKLQSAAFQRGASYARLGLPVDDSGRFGAYVRAGATWVENETNRRAAQREAR
uniref:Uncharacterized protein n=1 Tax=Caulobacter phage BL57 TaxID=3348355 RepID=A0AB74UIG0_9VIRU